MRLAANFNRFKTSERKQGKRVSCCVYVLAYTIEYYFASAASSLCTVITVPTPSRSASHTNLSPFLSFNISTNADGTTVVIDPPTNPVLVLYVIFIYLLFFTVYIYFYRLLYINIIILISILITINLYSIYITFHNIYIEKLLDGGKFYENKDN